MLAIEETANDATVAEEQDGEKDMRHDYRPAVLTTLTRADRIFTTTTRTMTPRTKALLFIVRSFRRKRQWGSSNECASVSIFHNGHFWSERRGSWIEELCSRALWDRAIWGGGEIMVHCSKGLRARGSGPGAQGQGRRGSLSVKQLPNPHGSTVYESRV